MASGSPLHLLLILITCDMVAQYTEVSDEEEDVDGDDNDDDDDDYED